MGKNRGIIQPFLKCETCGFGTKNAYIFKRHRIRCKRDVLSSKKAKVVAAAKPSGASLFASAAGMKLPTRIMASPKPEKKKSAFARAFEAYNTNHDEMDDSALSMVEDATPTQSADSSIEQSSATPNQGKRKHPYCRTYRCDKCAYMTTKSKFFLYHQNRVHNANLSIYSCTECEYSCKHRHKVQRHLKLVHKINIELDEVYAEYMSEKNYFDPNSQHGSGQHHNGENSLQISPAKSPKPPPPQPPQVNNTSIFNTSPTQKPATDVPSKSQREQTIMEMEDNLVNMVGPSGKLVYKCKLCLFNNADKYRVAKHVSSMHINAKTFKCSVCDYETTKKIEYFAHKVTHSNVSLFECSECTYTTDFRPNFDRHRNNHITEFAHKCKFCSYSCDHEGAIRRHEANNHANSDENVSVMFSNIVSNITGTDYEDSLDSATNFPQEMDPADVSEVNDPEPELEGEGEMMPSDESGPVPVLNTVEGRFFCPLCGLKYKRSSDLNRHMKQKHGMRMRDYLGKTTLEKSDLMVAVTLDDHPSQVESNSLSQADVEMSPTPGDMAMPLDLTYPDDDEQYNVSMSDNGELMGMENSAESLRCPYCLYQAKWPSDLRRHMSVHTIEKRYKCPHCEKQYKYVGDLNVHLRRDHKTEPDSVKYVKVNTVPTRKTSPAMFRCPTCSYSSPFKSEVDRHTKIHKNDKPFRCNYCNYQTHWKGDIRRHMYKHHPGVMADDAILENVITIVHDKQISNYDVQSDTVYVDLADDDDYEGIDENLGEGESMYEDENEGYPEMEMDYSQEMSMNSEDLSMNSSDISLSSNNVSGNFDSPYHMKESPGGMFPCEYCNFVTNAPSKLKAHVSTHINLKQYMCPVCGRRANWKWDIRKHIRKDHPESSLDVVKLSRQEAEATIKTYIDSNPVVRREHHLNISGQESGAEQAPNSGGKKLYKCNACGFKSPLRWTVSRHIRTLHIGMAVDIVYIGEEGSEDMVNNMKTGPELLPNTSTPNLDYQHKISPSIAEKPYKCFDCGKRCAIKADVRKHYHYIHPNKEVKIIYQDENGDVMLPIEEAIQRSSPMKMFDGFANNSLIKQEVVEVTPTKKDAVEKNYMCGECGKKGGNKGDIKKHYNYIHPDLEVKVIYTGDGEQSVLPSQYTPSPKVMSSSHEGGRTTDEASPLLSNNPKSFGYVKPFKCSVCGRRSNWKWDLNKHIRQKHGQAQIIILSEKEARETYEAYMREFSSIVHQSPAKHKKALSPSKGAEPYSGISHSNYRQFKCSACPYRSNWRSDLLRHINRKHGPNKAKLEFLDLEEAKQTLVQYNYNPRKRRGSGNNRIEPIRLKIRMPEGDKMGRIWKCLKCNFRDKDKVVVTNHLSTHNIKAYRCTQCKYTTNYRSSAFRHARSRHNRDNLSIFRIGLKYVKLDQEAESVEIIKTPTTETENHQLQQMQPPQLQPPQLQVQPLEVQATNANGFDMGEMESIELEETESVVDDEPEPYYDLFKCKFCEFRSNWKSCVARHLRDKHKAKDYAEHIIRVRKWVKEGCTEVKSSPKSQKRHGCNICPYRTDKARLLQFHMSCHKPQPNIQQEKCKYCPYYVVAPRLLHQHMKLHLQDVYNTKKERKKSSSSSSYSNLMLPPSSNLPMKRYVCEKCPYTSNSKNDYLYHKQFHRPNASAEFKCEYCDYWVTHKRLIKQHMKVHEKYSVSPSKYSSSSIQSSPCKSDISNSSEVYTAVQIAGYKQKLIASKITQSLSQSPVMSPMKIACSVGNKPGYVCRNGVYRKLHKCRKCPYQNMRLRNLKLHEMMHGNRMAKHPLMKCPHCDYYVGSKGLLSHHLKVHQPSYMADGTDSTTADLEIQEGVRFEDDIDDRSSDQTEISYENKVDSLLEIARFKKYSCEKCPYASAKRTHYERHIELHGSKQRCTCKFCDYSVPSNNLLAQHQRLHMSPNQNLLSTQSFSNLTLLPEVPADVALASALPPLDGKGSFTVSVTHDHMDMYENSEVDSHPKKLYRCDRCPYANVRRDHLLAHLKFHMLKSELACPYCDYSTSKQHLLSQHIKVHFNPLPELSNWLQQNGQIDRVEESKEPDISEALYVAKLYQKDEPNSPNKRKPCIEETKVEDKQEEDVKENGKEEKTMEKDESKEEKTTENGESKDEQIIEKDDSKDEKALEKTETKKETNTQKSEEQKADEKPEASKTEEEKPVKDEASTSDGTEVTEVKMECDKEPEGSKSDEVDKKAETNTENTEEDQKKDVYICQYCDREFAESNQLLRHEMQHLIGNNYEDYMGMVKMEINDNEEEEEDNEISFKEPEKVEPCPPEKSASMSSSINASEATNDTAKVNDDTAIPNNDTAKANNDTIKANNDTAKANNDIVMATNDIVMATNDIVVANSDTVKANNDAVVVTNDTAMANNDTAMSTSDTAMTSNDTTMVTNDTVMATDGTTMATNDTVMATNETAIATNGKTMATNDTTTVAIDGTSDKTVVTNDTMATTDTADDGGAEMDVKEESATKEEPVTTDNDKMQVDENS